MRIVGYRRISGENSWIQEDQRREQKDTGGSEVRIVGYRRIRVVNNWIQEDQR